MFISWQRWHKSTRNKLFNWDTLKCYPPSLHSWSKRFLPFTYSNLNSVCIYHVADIKYKNKFVNITANFLRKCQEILERRQFFWQVWRKSFTLFWKATLPYLYPNSCGKERTFLIVKPPVLLTLNYVYTPTNYDLQM